MLHLLAQCQSTLNFKKIMTKYILFGTFLVLPSFAGTTVKHSSTNEIPSAPIKNVSDIITVGAHSPFNSRDDKSQYHLFNPTPEALLRDLSPDRPDATESPITVDAGRFALEASLFDYRRDSGIESYTYGSLNFKAGLTHNMDFQTVVDIRSGSQDDWDTFGNLTFRLKWNLYGNDGGDTALALMPFVTAPTRDGKWEGGIIIPWATQLTDIIGLGLMAEFDYVHNGDDDDFEFLHTAVLGFFLTDILGAYTEYIGILSENHYQAYLAGGMNYEINSNLLLDFGVQAGLNSDSEDFGFFTGFTKRF